VRYRLEPWEIDDAMTTDLVETLVKLEKAATDHPTLADRRRYYTEITITAQQLADYAGGVASELEDPKGGVA
jgi:hypothetical protein